MADSSELFGRLIADALEAPFAGWDFSYLDGRHTASALPWDYCARVRQAVHDATSLLDVGTGGGELLASLAPLPPSTYATEAYPPNVPVARERLAPLGVTVVDTSEDEENRHLPFADAQFDLIINRHDCWDDRELWRILRDGGRFITQQCGGDGEVELVQWFVGRGNARPMDWNAARASRQLQEAGLVVTDAQEASPQSTFADVGAVVYYLRAIPWLVEDFSVARYRDRLLALHEHIQQHGGFTVTDQRFLIEAVKPGAAPGSGTGSLPVGGVGPPR